MEGGAEILSEWGQEMTNVKQTRAGRRSQKSKRETRQDVNRREQFHRQKGKEIECRGDLTTNGEQQLCQGQQKIPNSSSARA
ncbi:hypothetical protein PAAG_05852 [Paracoccidioides lutzii Pb01]|uniref:Uncharacterized protein n=1 Tax=Paracoccidioides lutzii (strain ATCC MYA-826 / Pb01) TaxID=502779 RepID=C1H511_PARBA|nr:hypothetical protein PAAG_05852 [Paracoccidioides lutzii Pb01]EEH34805.2 hypothetical protein PAAG_05852 [Paracoccidioides lutzii Pb01]